MSQLVRHTSLTTADTLWLGLPLLLGAGTLAWAYSRWIGEPGRTTDAAPRGLLAGFAVLRRSSYLTLVLALIAVTQLVITLIDYHFKGMLEAGYPETDQQTEIIGLVYGAIDIASVALQVLTGPILRLAGVGATLLLIPIFLGGAVGAAIAVPVFLTVAVAKVASKGLDYSLFRAAKEMLYLPLSYREKTEGKALVDMLTYRVAKAGVSALLLVFILLEAQALAIWLTIALLVVWVGLTYSIVRRYRAQLRSG